MRVWETASLIYFGYLVLVAPTAGRAGTPRVARLLIGAAAGMALAILSSRLDHRILIHDWIAPPALLLIGYWTSGLLFIRPHPRQEQMLMFLDRRAGIGPLARRLSRPIVELLELAYIGVYPLIPAGLVLHLLFAPQPDAERFWAVILITDYLCFATMPWVQTRPPRALEGEPPWQSAVRSLNLRVLGAASVQVNTFPSGHAAEALATTLLVLGSPGPVVALMAVAAVAVSAGAVLGRYHYLADALAGWVVACTVWAWLT